jgi:hypothetical protein
LRCVSQGPVRGYRFMSAESPSLPSTSALLRLRVTAEADLGALSRVLERFQNMNVVPRRVVAEMGSGDVLYIQVDIVGMAEERLSLITAKLNQALSIRDAHWHPV